MVRRKATRAVNGASLSIRPMRKDEIGEMVRVWKESGLPYRPTGRDSPLRLRKQYDIDHGLFIGAFSQGKIVGVSLVTHDGRKGWINRLAVLPAFRGRGVALNLIRSSERALKRRGIHIFCANIESDNKDSMQLFEKAGYKFEKEILYFAKRERQDY